MSFHLTQAIIRTPLKITTIEKMILISIADAVHTKKGFCYINQQTLRIRIGCGESSVKRGLKNLQRLGAINIKRRYNKANIYKINIDCITDNLLSNEVTMTPDEVMMTPQIGHDDLIIYNLIDKGIDQKAQGENQTTSLGTKMGYTLDDINRVKKDLKQVNPKTRPIKNYWVSMVDDWREEHEYTDSIALSYDKIKYLTNLSKKYDRDLFLAVMRHVIWNWLDFTIYAKGQTGDKINSKHPTVPVFVKYFQQALDFYRAKDKKPTQQHKKSVINKYPKKVTDKPKTKTQLEMEELKEAGLL